MKKLKRTLDCIEKSLQDAFRPVHLTVLDVSESHRGHSGFREGGESHFDVIITASYFAGMNRVAQHRAVHGALGAELMKTIHALALTIRSS